MDNSIIKGKNNNHKSRLSIRNSKNHKNTLSNPYNIIDVIDYNKSNKTEKSLNYNLVIQNRNPIRNNYQKIYSQNRTFNTENTINLIKNKGLYTSNN